MINRQRFDCILSLQSNMKKLICLLVIAFCYATAIAQLYLEPVAGYQVDINNNRFKMINTGIQFSWAKNKQYELMLQLQKSWPVSLQSGTVAYTSNPALSLSTVATKKINPSIFSFALGQRLVIAGKESLNKFSFLTSGGLVYQNIAVKYQYDKSNYTLLNPDQTAETVSVFVGAGIEYMRLLKNGRLFFQVNISTPPFADNPPAYSSFTFMAPVTFNAGYSIMVKKLSNEKRKKHRREKNK